MRTKGWKTRQSEAVRIGLAKNEAIEAAVNATKRRQAALELSLREAEASAELKRAMERFQEGQRRRQQQRQPSPGAAPHITFLGH